jgi:hypothetical protein
MISNGPHIRQALLVALAILIGSSVQANSTDSLDSKSKEFVPVGVFIGSIEEGARIFTPIRLLPFDHPESAGHEFPNALQLHQSEFDLIVWLGEQVGLKLKTTLERYPKPPATDWWYTEFRQIPVSEIKNAKVNHIHEEPPIPGLRAVAFFGEKPACFIVDTRGLSLEVRGMERATAMGLDMTRQEFLDGLDAARKLIAGKGDVTIIFDR